MSAVGGVRLGMFPKYDEVLSVKEENQTKYVQKVSEVFKNGSTPINVRKIVEAQHSAELKKANLSDGQSIRIKLAVNTVLGSPFSLATRALRTSWRTALVVTGIGPLYALGKAKRYGLKGELKDHLRRAGEEWIDLGISVEATALSLIKTVSPTFFTKHTNQLTQYYVNRAHNRHERDEHVKNQVSEYKDRVRRVKDAWRRGEPPVSTAESSAAATLEPVPAELVASGSSSHAHDADDEADVETLVVDDKSASNESEESLRMTSKKRKLDVVAEDDEVDIVDSADESSSEEAVADKSKS